MNLALAIAEFEARFRDVRDDRRAKDCVTIQSGAVSPPDLPAPCLCSSQDLAVDLWVKAATDWLPRGAENKALVWRVRPELRTYQMTMAERVGTQRIVTDRYSVYSELALAGDLDGARRP